jgi:integrase
LRLNEISAVKLSDIDRERMQLRVENGIGRKDRYTKLAAKVLPILGE